MENWQNWLRYWKSRLTGLIGPPETLNPSRLITPPPDAEEIVACLKGQGWWQGSVIPREHLSGLGIHLSANTHWIIASQTCNVYNPNLEAVPLVELVGADLLPEVGFKFDMSQGERPRVLHTRASAADDATLALSVQIQNRLWIDRICLTQIPSPFYTILDIPDDPAGRYKEILANWLARSYTRVELPDDFNLALDLSGMKLKILAKIRAKESLVHGVFFRIASGIRTAQDGEETEDAEDAAPMTPSEVAMAVGPFRLAITVVVYENCPLAEIQDIKRILDGINEDRIPIEKLPENLRANRKLCSISDLARIHGIEVEGCEVVGVRGWTVRDLMSTIRFTDYDYLSSAAETGDA